LNLGIVDPATYLTMLGFYIAAIAAGRGVVGLGVFMLKLPYKVNMRTPRLEVRTGLTETAAILLLHPGLSL
jgi:hypothetical protein